MNYPINLSRQETCRALQRQSNLGSYMLLGTAIITAVNILLLVLNSEVYIAYSCAMSYYLVWMGKGFDNMFGVVWQINGHYTVTGILLAGCVLAVLIALWLLSRDSQLWLKVGMGFIALDTLVLLGFSLLMGWGIMQMLWELVIHGVVFWDMWKALKARKEYKILLEQIAMEEAAQQAAQESAQEPLS